MQFEMSDGLYDNVYRMDETHKGMRRGRLHGCLFYNP